MLSFKKFFLLAFILVLCQLNVNAQNKSDDIVVALNSIIRPVQTLKPDSSFSDLRFLEDAIQDKNIVALGEVTHGTSEVFQYKDRLIRYLVSAQEYKAIGFESDFIAMQHLDDYVNHVADTIKFTGGFPLIKETRLMLSWLRDYNNGKADADRVHLFGLETRGFYSIASRILQVAPNISAADKKILNRLAEADYSTISRKDVAEMKASIPSLHQQRHINGDSEKFYKHYIELLEQQVDNFGKHITGRRDQFMATNASWILNNTASKKLIIWAHNGHVAKSALFGYKTMGAYLSEKYQYFVVATDFSEGEVSVFVKDQGRMKLKAVNYLKADSDEIYEYYFAQLKHDNFFLDIKASQQQPVLQSFLSQPLNMRMIGGTASPAYVKLAIAKHFDLIVFIKKSTAI